MRYAVVEIISKMNSREQHAFADRVLVSGTVAEASLFQALRNFLLKGEAEIDKIELYQEVFGSASYNDLKLRKLMVGLKKQLELFLLQAYLQKDSALRSYLLSHIYEERGAPKLFQKQIRQAKETSEVKSSSSVPMLSAWTKHLEFYHVFTSKLDLNQHLLVHLISSFDQQLILRRFFYQVEYKIFGHAFNLSFHKEIEQTELLVLRWVKHLSLESALFSWLLKLYEQLVGNNTERIDIGQELENYHEFVEELGLFERQMTIKLLLNLAKGDLFWQTTPGARLRLKIYQEAIQESMFLHNGTLDEGQFLNIVVTAAIAKELDWMQQFIDKEFRWLPETKQNDCLHLAQAYLHYHRGLQNKLDKKEQFDLAAKHISQVADRDPRLGLRVRSLSIRIHFEFIEREGLYFLREQLIKMRRYLKRSRLAPELVDSYQCFLQYTQLLATYHWDGVRRKEVVIVLLDKLRQEPVIALRSWLIEKLEELIPLQ